MTAPVTRSPLAEPPHRQAALAGRGGRIALVLALLAALVPAVIAGRHTTAQDASGTPEATPATPASPAAQTVAGLQTASVVPADVLLFAAMTIDPTSGQIIQSQELLDRAGLGELVDSLFAEAVPETIGISNDPSMDTSTGASTDATADATPVTGEDAPDLGVILDGEVAVAVGDQVIEAFGESLDEGADAVADVVEDSPAAAEPTEAVAEPAEPEEVIEEVAENSAEAVEEAVEGSSDEESDDPLDNIDTSNVEDDEEDTGAASDSPASSVEPSQPSVEAEPSGVVAVVRPSDPDAAATEIDALLLESSRASDTAIEETEASGVTISSLPPDHFGSDGIAVARLGDVFVVSGTPADLEPYAAVYAGEALALDADPAFVKARTELPDDFLSFGFVNGPSIVSALELVLAEVERGAGRRRSAGDRGHAGATGPVAGVQRLHRPGGYPGFPRRDGDVRG